MMTLLALILLLRVMTGMRLTTPACIRVSCAHQGASGRRTIATETKPVNSRRYVATFHVDNTTKEDSGRYRCIGQSGHGVGVSSYADLTVKRKSSLWPCFHACARVSLGDR